MQEVFTQLLWNERLLRLDEPLSAYYLPTKLGQKRLIQVEHFTESFCLLKPVIPCFPSLLPSKAPCKRTQLSWLTSNCWMIVLLPFVHLVACCWACTKFQTGQTFEPTSPNISFVSWSSKRSATILDPFAQLSQHCWSHALALHIVSEFLWVVPFPVRVKGGTACGMACGMT